MPRRVIAYQCAYCGVLKKSENICFRHELSCLSNPQAQNCLLCKHQTVDWNDTKKCIVRGCTCTTATSARCSYYESKDDFFPTLQ